MRYWLVAALLYSAAVAVHAEEISAKVIVVIDGDTVVALLCTKPPVGTHDVSAVSRCTGSGPVKLRLADIDAPEKDQPGGVESTRSLAGMVQNKRVSVEIRAVDKYGRRVAHLAMGTTSVNEEQVRRGMAWEYSNFHSNKRYVALQREARQAKRGLWSQPGPTPPWRWRKMHAAGTFAVPRHTPGNPACGSKRYCAQMNSCAEARFFYTHCGVATLDGNGDGVPCENLCGTK